MFASRRFRLASVFATVLMVMTAVGIDQAEARRGGSFGSRGTRTFQTVPSTPTSPGVTAPVQRSMTPSQQNTAAPQTAAAARQSSAFGGFGGSLMRGLMFGGLLGLLFGAGFGGGFGFLGLLLQIGLLLLLARFLFGAFANRQRPAMAGGPTMRPDQMFRSASGPSPTPQRASASTSPRKSGGDELRLTATDKDRFEKLLQTVQAAYANEDYGALRAVTTPEVMSFLSEELGQNASRGVRNEVYDVKLLQGDISESWREGTRDYASAAMRYQSVDVTRSRSDGSIVEGNPTEPTETTEIWTFVRERGADWKLSAIQEA